MGWLSPRKSGDESKASQGVLPALTGAPVPLEPFPLPGSPFTSTSEHTSQELADSAVSDSPGQTPGGHTGEGSAAEVRDSTSGDPVAGQPSPIDDEVRERLDRIATEQASLRELFHTRLRNDEVQNRSLDRLLAELTDYKADFVRRRMLPLLREVIDCHDLAHRESRRLSGTSAVHPETEAARKSLEVVAQMLRDLLSRHDVESYEADGPDFDPKSQQCTRTVPTSEAALDKRVAESIVPGFRSEGTLLRRELVAVYRHTPHADDAGPAHTVTSSPST